MTREADAALAAKLMARDEKALAEAVELYGGIVNGMARRIVAEATLAEEVAQDVFVALWRRPGAFDPERGSLKTFLATLARNKAVDLVRHEQSVRRTKDSLLAEFSTTAERYEFADKLESRAEIHEALARIPESQREVIALAYFGGRTYREVATELAIPEGTAKTRMRDGLAKLRSVLSATREDSDGE
ncbi:MAG: sigma-70 family RNA polymerase sigma factor [Actinomycetota bacterium]